MVSFEEKVLQKCSLIPKGKVTTYKELAKSISSPNSSRAVGNALNKNLVPIKIPCHRVIQSNGNVGGYAFGVKRKIALLKSEGIEILQNKVVNFGKVLFSFK
ncbi:MAG: MGMT family protein [archaeon]|jgi:methylated-DNA-[protein]-cysteine S-methyltransferase